MTSLDLVNKKVVIDEKDTLIYDRLVLSTGGTSRRLPVPGADLENVYTLRGIEDSKKIDAGLSSLARRNTSCLILVYSGSEGQKNGSHWQFIHWFGARCRCRETRSRFHRRYRTG